MKQLVIEEEVFWGINDGGLDVCVDLYDSIEAGDIE